MGALIAHETHEVIISENYEIVIVIRTAEMKASAFCVDGKIILCDKGFQIGDCHFRYLFNNSFRVSLNHGYIIL